MISARLSYACVAKGMKGEVCVGANELEFLLQENVEVGDGGDTALLDRLRLPPEESD